MSNPQEYTHLVMILCAVLGLVGFVVSLICVAIIAGFVRSTHTVKMVPLDPIKEVEADLGKPTTEEDEEREILAKVGRKKKPQTQPLVVDEVAEIVQSDSF